MGIEKSVKSLYCKSLNSSDKVREMMIASANYSPDLAYCPVQEIIIQSPQKASRKRRLEHLTTEEKINRKKLKNREAAQTSRDRKKAYVTSLEEAVKLLQQENKLLSERVSLLEEENKKLRESEDTSRDGVMFDAAGPAVSSDPLQQGASYRKPKPLVKTHHRAVTLIALMTALTSLSGCPQISGSSKMMKTMTSRKTSLTSLPLNSSLLPSLRKALERRWWGPGGGKRAWRPPPPALYQ